MSSNVGSVNGNNPYAYTSQSTYTNKTNGQESLADANNAVLNPSDAYVPSGTDASTSSTSTKKTSDVSTLQSMWDQAHSATAALRNLVASMLGNNKTGEGVGQSYYAMMANGNVKVPDDVKADAERMIGEDGYYGVKQTTGRIMDFAKALAGDNASLDDIKDLRSGAQKGFDDVAKMFGGFDKLPEVTKKTYEAVMKAFDEWEASVNGGTAASATETAATEATA